MGYLKGRWQEMGWGRRIILLIQPAMFLLFLAVYLAFGRQQVVSYRDGHLRFEQQGDAAVYSGRVDGHDIRYAVPSSQVVEFWVDGALDSVYTITEDPTAIPQTGDFAPDFFTGVEIRQGDEVWFRGAYSPYLSYLLLDENGDNAALSVTFAGAAEKLGPDPAAVLRFAQGPEISSRGYGPGLLLGLLLSAMCAVYVLFEDQLFRWQMSFRIQEPDRAEPSEWEILSRWVGWIALTGMALVLYALAAGLGSF